MFWREDSKRMKKLGFDRVEQLISSLVQCKRVVLLGERISGSFFFLFFVMNLE